MEININPLEPANKLFDKIADACGFFAKKKTIQNKILESHAERVIADESLTYEEKEEFIRSIPHITKKRKNREKIIEIASDNLVSNAKPEDIEDDWLMDYMDKIKNIASKDGQLMWGKLLASEANAPGTISKRLVHNIYLMDQRDAWQFTMFTAFCFYDGDNPDVAHPLIYMRKKPNLYFSTFLTTQFIHNLQNWGLIECNYDPGFIFITRKHLIYRGSTYTLSADKLGGGIDAGNIRFTKDGQALFNIVDKENDNSILDKTLEAFASIGINYEISGRKGVWQSDAMREVYKF